MALINTWGGMNGVYINIDKPCITYEEAGELVKRLNYLIGIKDGKVRPIVNDSPVTL